MRLTDKYFWIAWAILALLLCGSMFTQSPGEDTLCLGFAYTLSLLSTWLCHRLRDSAALYNIAVMIAYNAILIYNLTFNSSYGAGFTWWILSLVINSLHSSGLLVYCAFIRFRTK